MILFIMTLAVTLLCGIIHIKNKDSTYWMGMAIYLLIILILFIIGIIRDDMEKRRDREKNNR